MDWSKHLVAASLIVTTFTLALAMTGTAAGTADNTVFRVLDNDGNHIENATVLLVDNNGDPVKPEDPGHDFTPDLENFGVTDENGEIYYGSIGEDNYDYLVGKTGYEFVDGIGENVEILNDNIEVGMTEPENSQDATFNVEGEGGENIEGAMVLIGLKDYEFPYLGDLTTTDSNGEVKFENLEPENYMYMIGKSGYEPEDNFFEITDSDFTKNIILTETPGITVEAENAAGENIEGATVGLWRLGSPDTPPVFIDEKVTDENGQVVFGNLEPDNYCYNVGKKSYADNFAVIQGVDSNVTKSVILRDADHKVTFNVLDSKSGENIENATVALVKEEENIPSVMKRTDENGEAILRVFADNYEYAVQKENYEPVYGVPIGRDTHLL